MTTDTPSDLVKRLRSWAQNEEMIDTSFTEHGKVCNAAADRIEQLAEAEKFRDYFERESVIWRKRAEKAERELAIKSEFLSSRQCPDHAGKWERGRCLQCEIERLRRELARVHELHTGLMKEADRRVEVAERGRCCKE